MEKTRFKSLCSYVWLVVMLARSGIRAILSITCSVMALMHTTGTSMELLLMAL